MLFLLISSLEHLHTYIPSLESLLRTANMSEIPENFQWNESSWRERMKHSHQIKQYENVCMEFSGRNLIKAFNLGDSSGSVRFMWEFCLNYKMFPVFTKISSYSHSTHNPVVGAHLWSWWELVSIYLLVPEGIKMIEEDNSGVLSQIKNT